ncbi:hypothetical protein DOTSEDRAFT_87522 [Dothistroma septosporum NZE10]|uniref:AB hydrolase-1 domain-containing protein n=1 Tax=Dothistroma septosporum (strain NZE10 / CBS 128990) TaxID=675120 RepID=N1PRM1_DOTSN|nr:hypothetical protein DOTSEDRAFT_87522 [Dothistroma septosporum NZE10]
MLKDSTTNRRVIRTVISIFQAHGPFCLCYTLWVVTARCWPVLAFGRDKFLDRQALWLFCIPEAIWYLFMLYYAQYIQREAIHPPMRNRDERQQLFSKIRSEIYDPITFVSGWFRGADPRAIGKDELRKFIDWAFWEGRAGEEHGDAAEIEEYVQKIEKMMPRGFAEGTGKAKSLRLTLDAIEIEPRSLLWYAVIMLGDVVAVLLLQHHGFQYYRLRLPGALAVFPPRPICFTARKVSAAPGMSYYHRKHTSKSRLPVLHIHGIGIGILPHVAFLHELDYELNNEAVEDDHVGIIAVEILQISSRLSTPILRRAEFLTQITTIIDQHFGSGPFVLVSHSYGSIMSTHILNDHRLSPRVSGTLLIDPVTFLLHMPDVAYNFTIRPPVRTNEWLLWFFASKDPQIAHTLGRHFFWSENLLWRDQIDHLITNHGMRLTTSLASDDLIVNTDAVRAYLTERDLPDPVVSRDEDGLKRMQLQTHPAHAEAEKSKKWHGSKLDVIWWEGYDHATVFDQKKDRARLVDVLVRYSTGSS